VFKLGVLFLAPIQFRLQVTYPVSCFAMVPHKAKKEKILKIHSDWGLLGEFAR